MKVIEKSSLAQFFFRHFLFFLVFALEAERVRQEQPAFQVLCF